MKKVLVVLSSVRENRAADNVLELLSEQAKSFPELRLEVVDFKQTPLPLIDSPHSPANENFDPKDENVLKWTDQVRQADVVLILEAEYNHSYTPVIKNAIDWIYKEWESKPVALIGYGWVGGARATKHLRDVFASNINAEVIETEANLRFTKEIELDGTPIDDQAGKLIENVLKSI